MKTPKKPKAVSDNIPYQTTLDVRLGNTELKAVKQILKNPIFKPYKANIILQEFGDRDGSNSVYLKNLPINMVWRLSSELEKAIIEENGNKNYKMLLEGALELLNAPHNDHFFNKLNNLEFAGLEKIKKAVNNIQKGI